MGGRSRSFSSVVVVGIDVLVNVVVVFVRVVVVTLVAVVVVRVSGTLLAVVVAVPVSVTVVVLMVVVRVAVVAVVVGQPPARCFSSFSDVTMYGFPRASTHLFSALLHAH